MKQLTHDDVVNGSHDKSIVVMADRMSDLANTGMLFRASEAFGVERIVFIDSEVNLKDKKLIRISRSSSNRIDSENVIDPGQVISSLKESGYYFVGIEYCDSSVPLYNAQLDQLTKVCLIIGHEKLGVSQELLDVCDQVVHIPMYGINTSMNVIQAASISLYELTRPV